eukprot:CAMPEP_0177710628 /NCGR_PEP_ID=MMETSP0484_2-20121128/11435_1 /TAXON_ID=354590 /ORGANISM="Rhodomonas lens, Strain RHODO" /LENGTH=202 /DNA_ID=CAMNT_0019222319 /DNA_START=67 /DNA_END=675 /DNA_ORIENTATION=+
MALLCVAFFPSLGFGFQLAPSSSSSIIQKLDGCKSSRQHAHARAPVAAGRRASASKFLRMSGSDEIDMSAFLSEVERRDVIPSGGPAMDGPELRKLIMDKWRYPLDTRIHRRGDGFGKMTVWVQVMWKHVWEASFPMTEEEYDAQLEAVAWFITEWGKADYLRNEIATTDQSPGLNQSGKGKAVMIKLDLTEEQIGMMFDTE